MTRPLAAVLAAVLILAPAGAMAQLPPLGLPPTPTLPGGGGLPGGTTVERGLGTLDDTGRSVRELTRRREDGLRDLLRRNRRELDTDERGQVVVRGQLLAVNPSPVSLATAARLGFTVIGRERLEGAGLDLITLAPPRGEDVRTALRRLKRADPSGEYDYNHIYSGAGETAAALPWPAFAWQPLTAGGTRVGLVDSGVDARHPALGRMRIEQRGFAPGGVRPAPHGTAAASLMMQQAGGGTLLVADVYGAGPTGGSSVAIASGLGWLGQAGAQVINVSLVGPPNAALRAAIARLAQRGVLIVAAVGNDGPAARPLFPAAWPEVVAVTGVDRRGRVLPEACRGPHVDFAAPGVQITAARPGGGMAAVRGTSFAAPLAAGRLAALRQRMGPGQALQTLSREARDLGAPGRDPIYGDGLIADR